MALCTNRAAQRACSARPQAPSAARIAVVQQRPRVVLARSASVSVSTEGKVVALSSGEYEEFLAAHADSTVIVDYYTDWCGPCKMIAPHLEEMAAEMTHVKFAKLNCTTDPAAKKIAMAQGIKALPTFHLFKKGERAATFVGGKPQQLRKFLEEHA